MKKTIVVMCLCISFVIAGIISLSYADDAEVLPKGVFRVNTDTKFWFPVYERYNNKGDLEDVAKDFNGILDSYIFPDLGLLEYAFGMPAGSANIGRSIVSFKYGKTDENISLMYGVTDRLTIGLEIPYYWQKNKVKAMLDNSNATIWKNPCYQNTTNPVCFAVPGIQDAPMLPKSVVQSLGFSDTPLTTEDVINLLSGGLDVNGDGAVDIPGYGYKRFEKWSGSGIGDIEAGLRYQYLKTENWRLALTGGVRFPTGKVDDTDNLVDLGFGDGSYALLLRLNNDYTGIKNLVLNATISYDLILPYKKTLRVPDDVNQPITFNKEKVKKDIGDIIGLEVSGKYRFAKGFDFSLLYNYKFSLKDKISGNKGYIYKALEDETDTESHIYIVGLSYSTLPLFMEKKFPLPITASISYRNRFAGSNNVFKSQYVAFALGVYF